MSSHETGPGRAGAGTDGSVPVTGPGGAGASGDEHRLAGLRAAYPDEALLESAMPADPFEQFRHWLADAIRAGLPEPNAMVLCTADGAGRPGGRHVLLKGFDESGFVFFTNYGSRKAADLAANPRAALVFPWFEMSRQVIVEGEVARTSPEETRAYWATRPYDSQIGAWASEQSAVVPGREHLELRARQVRERFPEPGPVPVPPQWGGFRVVPAGVEFWRGRAGRLHDRLRYRRTDAGSRWTLERLSP